MNDIKFGISDAIRKLAIAAFFTGQKNVQWRQQGRVDFSHRGNKI